MWEKLEVAWAEGNICKKKGWASMSLCGIDTRIVDLLHIEDDQLLVLLLLDDVEAVPPKAEYVSQAVTTRHG